MRVTDDSTFDPWLQRWKLEPDGAPILTPGSRLLPVRRGDVPAMLKIAFDDEEKFGNLLMNWWNGDGAARVYEHHVLEDGKSTAAQGQLEVAQLAASRLNV